jgi:hypothetical protein
MVKFVDRAKMTTSTTGVGVITLGSAVVGYQTFASAGAVNADVFAYGIEDGTAWEIGYGTYSAGTLTRTLRASSTGALLNLSGNAIVYATAGSADFSTVARTGAYSDLTGLPTLGSLAALNAAPAGSLTGSTLAAGVTASSLTSVGTLVGGSIPYSLLTGTPTLGSMAAASTSSYAPVGGVGGNFTIGGTLGVSGLLSANSGAIVINNAPYAAPATTGSAADGSFRITNGGHGEILDAGIGGNQAWLQARTYTSYASNIELHLNPNGGLVTVGSGGFQTTGNLNVGGVGNLAQVQIGTTNNNRKLNIGATAETLNGILLYANATPWYLDNRGSSNSNQFWFSVGGGALLSLDTSGNGVFAGSITATTGAFSGAVSTGALNVNNSVGSTTAATLSGPNGNVFIDYLGSGGNYIDGGTTSFRTRAGVTYAYVNPTGLNVTGTGVFSGNASFNGVNVGNGVTTGLYGDASNIALRSPTSGGTMYFQGPSGSVNWATLTATQFGVTGINVGTGGITSAGNYSGTTGTFTGALTLGSSTAAGSTVLNGPAASNRLHYIQSVGYARWAFGTDTATESGSNAGCNFAIYSYGDGGGFLGNPLTINRSTAAATFSANLTANGRIYAGGGAGNGFVTLQGGSTTILYDDTNGHLETTTALWINGNGTAPTYLNNGGGLVHVGSGGISSTGAYSGTTGSFSGAVSATGNLYGSNLVLVSTGQIAVSGANTLFTPAPVGSNTTLLRSDGTGSNGMRMEDRGGNLLGFLYGDGGTGGNYGLLGSNANWRFRTTPSGAWLTASGVEYPMVHTGNISTYAVDLSTAGQNVYGNKNFHAYSGSNINITSSGTTGEINALEIISDGQSNTGAYMSLHRPGIFAGFFGLNPSNRLVYGGYSWGANEYQLHSTQDFTINQSPVGSTVVQRDVSGHLYGNFVFAGGYVNVGNRTVEDVAITMMTGQAYGSDGYLRQFSRSRVREFVGLKWTSATSAYTMTAGERVYVTPSAAITITLPASPADGDECLISGDFGTYNMTVARNGSTIEGSATDLININVNRCGLRFLYKGSTWKVYRS